MRLRAPTVEDLPALTRFFATLNEIYGTGGETEAELRAWLESPIFDRVADFRVAMAENGLVGWCDVWDQNRTRSRFFADVRAHPRTATVYAALLDWADGRARAAAEPPAFLRVWCDAADEVCAGEVRRRGFRLNRHFLTMEIDLDEEPAPPEWPEGISVRTFRPEDAHAVHKASSEAFADHWDFVPLTFDEWAEFLLRSPGFDASLWFIAEEGSEIAGLSLCQSERRPDTGHVRVLGVRGPWRRRGLGRNLLLHSFRELRRHGRGKADLGVDAENTTGAVRLYERAGMHVARRSDSYELELV